MEKLQLGAFTLATTAVLEVVLSDKFPSSEILDLVVLGFMGACGFLWNGFLFGNLYLQSTGIVLCLLSFNALVAASLHTPFACASWLFSTLCVVPFLYLVINPAPSRPQGPPDPQTIIPPTSPTSEDWGVSGPQVTIVTVDSIQHEFIAPAPTCEGPGDSRLRDPTDPPAIIRSATVAADSLQQKFGPDVNT